MHRSVLAVLACAAFAGLFGVRVADAQSYGRQITRPIDDRVRTTLPGNTRPEARNPKNDRGVLADNIVLDHMLLQLKRPPKAEHRLQRLITQFNDPRSPNFHNWLTASEIGREFGPATRDVRKVAGWLTSKGFTVNAIYASGMVIDFSGTAGEVSQAFSTPLHYLSIKGVKHIANMSDPQIPAALTPVVAGIVSLHDFRPHGMYHARPKYAFKADDRGSEAVVPADIARIYNFNPLFAAGITGKGQTIAVVEDSNLYASSDWTRFRSSLGLTSYASGTLATIHPNAPTSHGDCGDPGANGDDGEATVDAEWASAGAPGATVEVASCRSSRTTFGGLIALENLVNAGVPPPVISVSYGECESYLGAAANAAYNAVYQQAAAEGISVFAASGNEDAASCDAGQWVSFQGLAVNGLASTPYNVAVGGTDFADTYLKQSKAYWRNGSGPARSYVPEIPWNDSCASVLGAVAVTGVSPTDGLGGFCDTNAGAKYWQVVGGGGGHSGCAAGAADPNNAAAVSGTCAGYAKPRWQNSVFGAPGDGARDMPDVSLFAGDGIWSHYYAFCWSDVRYGGFSCAGAPSTWAGGGGTSFATPLLAAIQVLVDQKTGARQGDPDPEYYALAAKEYGTSGSSSCNSTLGNAASRSCIFYDVTLGDTYANCTSAQDLGLQFSGNNGPANCSMNGEFMGRLSSPNTEDTPAYMAATGWDFATGIGTVNAANLVNAWP